MRDLTRQRTKLVQQRAAVVNRLQKVLEWANLKLAAVVTDVTGTSALDTIPGVGQQTAELLLAEIGCDMSRFKSDAHLALRG